MQEGASTNNVHVAMRTLNVVLPHVFDVACFSNTLDGVGSNFSIPMLLKFWVSLFSHGPEVKLSFKEKT